MKVSELKAILNGVDDDLDVVIYDYDYESVDLAYSKGVKRVNRTNIYSESDLDDYIEEVRLNTRPAFVLSVWNGGP